MILSIVSFATSKYGRVVLIALAVLALVVFIDNRGYNRGVEDTTAKYEAAIQREKDRQAEIFRQTILDRDQREAELRRLLEARNNDIRSLLEEGASDPHSQRESVGVDGVRRLNRIQ